MATIEIAGILRDYVKNAPGEIGPLEGKTILEVIRLLGLPGDLVAFVMVNGTQAPKAYRIRPGDRVQLIPFIGGG